MGWCLTWQICKWNKGHLDDYAISTSCPATLTPVVAALSSVLTFMAESPMKASSSLSSSSAVGGFSKPFLVLRGARLLPTSLLYLVRVGPTFVLKYKLGRLSIGAERDKLLTTETAPFWHSNRLEKVGPTETVFELC